MYKVLIADDEKIIRMGLRSIIDWEDYGFTIIGEAANGTEALNFMRTEEPDLVIIDIRMPKMHGLDAIKNARDNGFTGQIIVLSGYSDFEYAKTAISYGVNSYLTKPVDVDDLIDSLKKSKETLDEELASLANKKFYVEKAHDTLLEEFMLGSLSREYAEDPSLLGLTANKYQVVLYEAYRHTDEISYSFSDLIRVTNQNGNSYDFLQIDGCNVVLLKGNHTIEKFQYMMDKYTAELPPEKNSPLDTIFISCGPVVVNFSEIPNSYRSAKELLSHRFFCDKHQHIVTIDDVPTNVPKEEATSVNEISAKILTKYTGLFVNHIQSFNRNKIAETLNELRSSLYLVPLDVEDQKNMLVDLYLHIKEQLLVLYNKAEIPFIANSEAVNYIMHSNHLYLILQFLSEQFEVIMNAIGYSSRDSIIDDVIFYINHNYASNITLENIAPLFGYNSSYLGKIFSKKMGVNFNTYLDEVRIEHSKEILTAGKMQVYKVAEMVGYKNVDYFHIKFKKYTGMSPAEFRKNGQE